MASSRNIFLAFIVSTSTSFAIGARVKAQMQEPDSENAEFEAQIQRMQNYAGSTKAGNTENAVQKLRNYTGDITGKWSEDTEFEAQIQRMREHGQGFADKAGPTWENTGPKCKFALVEADYCPMIGSIKETPDGELTVDANYLAEMLNHFCVISSAEVSFVCKKVKGRKCMDQQVKGDYCPMIGSTKSTPIGEITVDAKYLVEQLNLFCVVSLSEVQQMCQCKPALVQTDYCPMMGSIKETPGGKVTVDANYLAEMLNHGCIISLDKVSSLCKQAADQASMLESKRSIAQ